MSSTKVYVAASLAIFLNLIATLVRAQEGIIVENETLDDIITPQSDTTVETNFTAEDIKLPDFEDLAQFQEKVYEGPGTYLGNGTAVFVPLWILVIILIGFLGAMGYLIMHIFNSQRQSEYERQAKKQIKAERKAAKATVLKQKSKKSE